MIYEKVELSMPIRQGDVFFGLPRIDVSLDAMTIAHELGDSVAKWSDIAESGEPALVIVPVQSVIAIVASQDCDATRSRDITLCEIRSFREVEGKADKTTSPKAWKNIITQQARVNQKWFYLPPDKDMGFSEKMAVDFTVTIRLPRSELEGLRGQRRGRLNAVADEHFRERIGEFFRRYPYDEWYPLDHEEFAAYCADHDGTIPFEWQEDSKNSRE